MPFTFHLDDTTEDNARASIAAALRDYNTYIQAMRDTELQEILTAMLAAKSAYFAALAELKGKLQELAQEEQRLSALMKVYDMKGSLESANISKLSHPQHYISTYEIIADRALD